VIEADRGTVGLTSGDRVVSNGNHAEIVVVPRHLCARIPDSVDDESAAFTVLGAIALQGIRLAAPTLGESFVVIGLGTIGLLAVQLLRANGCRVLGVDTDASRLELAGQFGVETVNLSAGEDPLTAAASFSRGYGVDGVLLVASTSSSEPVSQAARMCRKRGRIVLIGVTGLELNRAEFYEKEIFFQVSCSYGPGRYDREYEEKGHDYPVGLVRWTEQRNFEAVLDMMAAGRLEVQSLITHRFPVEEAAKAYDVLASRERSLSILITYPAASATAEEERLPLAHAAERMPGNAVTGFIGAGNYGGRVLAKAFKDAGAGLHTIVSASGVSAAHYGRKLGFAHAGTDPHAILRDAAIDSVCIATRHDSHAGLVRAALRAGKHVFVEKPLCITLRELEEVIGDLRALERHGRMPILTVGFNRRFAPTITKAKSLISGIREPKSFIVSVNAGSVPNDHWTQDPEVGGGRIIGEACHFIDLLRYLAAEPIAGAEISTLQRAGGPACPDTAVITLRFAAGSLGVINYFANGHKSVPKERLEIYCADRILLLDNYRRLVGYGWRGFSTMRSWRQNKGHVECAAAFVAAVKNGGPAPIPLDEILEVSRVTLEVANRL
jgi:predicted dehydrogenase/threonine dehydrogenase-like Zn-dependent dehydrogenase